MRETIITICLLAIITALGCNKDDENTKIKWDKESEEMLTDGMDCGAEESTIILRFTANTMEEAVSATSNENWIDVNLSFRNGRYELTLTVSQNEDTASREGSVLLIVNGEINELNVRQKGAYYTLSEFPLYSIPAKGGEYKLKVMANGRLNAHLSWKDSDWLTVTDISKDNENDDLWTVTLDVEENPGLGRITNMTFEVDGKYSYFCIYPCLVQEPAAFNESVEVHAKDPGMLQVLLGSDMENIRRIRDLSITGCVNGLDFPLLKAITHPDENASEYGLRLDLKECSFNTGYANPFDMYYWEPENIDTSVPVFYGELPENLFTDSPNLQELILPRSLRLIGRRALSGCIGLKEIAIPDNLEEIGHKAFWQSSGLEKIVISENSNIFAIGNQAFTTGSRIETLSFPGYLTYISPEAFLGCDVAELHLHWEYPEELKIVPNPETCILYVPKGTKDRYLKTPDWNKFTHIIEE